MVSTAATNKQPKTTHNDQLPTRKFPEQPKTTHYHQQTIHNNPLPPTNHPQQSTTTYDHQQTTENVPLPPTVTQKNPAKTHYRPEKSKHYYQKNFTTKQYHPKKCSQRPTISHEHIETSQNNPLPSRKTEKGIQKSKSFEPFTRKVGQRAVIKFSDSCSSKLEREMLPSRFGI